MRGWFRRCAVLSALIMAVVLTAPTAFAQTTYSFNLPEQPLADSLRAIGQQTEMNILFEPDAVKSVRGPALRGNYTADDAIRWVLKGTQLEAQHTTATNVVVKLKSATTTASPAESSSSAASQGTRIAQSSTSGPDIASSVVPANSDDSEKQKLSEVVVTGTHIRDIASASPVIEITRKDIDEGGFTSTPQLFSSLPQNFNGGSGQIIGAQGPSISEFSGYQGTSVASLRGLGDATLTLVDGHRLAGTGGTNGADLASIPLAAIEKVEVVPDGASSIYGSDAVAGVINIILKKDYDGVQVSLGESTPTRSGGGQQQNESLVAGTHWATGNVLASYTGQNQDQLYARSRDFSSQAADPTTLIPGTHSNSATVYLNQDLGDRASFYGSLLYNDRTASIDITESGAGYSDSYYEASRAKAYTGSAGVLVHAGGDWIAGLDFSDSWNKDYQPDELVGGLANSVVSISQATDRDYSTELHASGSLLSVPTGTVKGAFGGGVRHETFDSEAPLTPIYDTSASRRDSYLYAELEAPLLAADTTRIGATSLDVTVSARADNYSDIGTSTSPKLGVIYGITPDLQLRGTYGRSFRAPLLSDLVYPNIGYLFVGNDPAFPTGKGVTLYEAGGNPDLKPETSRSWTATLDFTPTIVHGLSLSASYFSYNFSDKILAPITGNFLVLPLNGPSLSPFVTRFPSSSQVQAIANGLAQLQNFAGPGATLNDVEALLDNRFTNVSDWQARGADFQAAYKADVGLGSMTFKLNGSKLLITDKPTPTSASQDLSGVVFGPPTLRIRGGGIWSYTAWNLASFVNYTSGETDIYSSPQSRVGSFTTVDFHAGYTLQPSAGYWLSGLSFSLNLLNAFDRSPPALDLHSTEYPGIGYDAVNASPLGRVVSFQVTKSF